jgi:CDP-diacylglycerol--glycerol-3-phosphate 3-phosphatidyltransferase
MKIYTIPNIMTLSRLFLLYPIIYYLQNRQPWLSVLFMGLGVLTDLLDGIVARKFNQQSDLGRIMDPLIDKINVIAVAVYMVISPHYNYPLWFLLLVVLREITVLLGGMWVLRGRKIVMEATKPGKRSAFFTGLTIPLYLLGWQPWALICLYLALVLNCHSTWVYIQRFREQLKQFDSLNGVSEDGGAA